MARKPATWARRLRLVKPATALIAMHRAPTRAIVRGSPKRKGSGSLALLKRGQCDPLKERDRNGTALAGTLNGK